MSLHYLLDGYNIIHQVPALASGTLEERRDRLARMIEALRPQGSSRNQVTIVFDGREDVYGAGQGSAVEIIFARGESADEKIKKLVAAAENKKNMVVVTDDRDIRTAVRALGAKTKTVQEFLGKVNQIPLRRPPAGKHISKTLEYRITQEMEGIWLKKKRP